jgi:hypothetical protein
VIGWAVVVPFVSHVVRRRNRNNPTLQEAFTRYSRLLVVVIGLVVGTVAGCGFAAAVILFDRLVGAVGVPGYVPLLVLFLGFYRNSSRIRFLGMLTILLVVGKLFLVDLSQISTLLRILLFIGFGVVFLVVRYLLHQKWGDTEWF